MAEPRRRPVFVRLLRPVIGILVSLVCLGLFLRSVSPQEVGESLARANPIFLVPAVGVYFVGTLVRSLRWRVLLGPHRVPVPVLFRSLVIGLTVNDLVPAKLGEVARIFLLARSAGVPIGASLASIVLERVLDGIALTALLGVGILWAGAGGWLIQLAALSAAMFGVATAILIWGAVAPGPLRWLGHAVAGFAPGGLRDRLVRLMDASLEGLKPIGRVRSAVEVIGLSLVAWALEAGMYLLVMVGFQIPGGVPAGLIGTAVASLATLVPSGPGYVGTLDLALKAVLVDGFGASPGDAASYTLTVHFLLIAPVVALGLFFLWRENLSLPDLGRRPRSLAEPPVAGR
jgi:uncharacterized membrane protein YbhN (UPF0104 family)